MHILFIPSFYPEPDTPFNGMFFKNQSVILTSETDKIGTVYVEQKSLKKIFKNFRLNLFQKTIKIEEGVITYRRHGINLLNQYNVGAAIWVRWMEKLSDDYIKDNGIPDIIHAHNVFYAGQVAYNLSKKLGIPYIVTEHASGFLMNEYSKKLLKKASIIYKKAKHVLAVSKSLGNALQFSCDVADVKIVPNVVNTQLFKPGALERKNQVFTFVSVGNLLENKGHHILIQAFSGFNKRFPETQLHIVGEGPEYSNLLVLISELSLTSKVFLKGKKSPEDLVILYQKSHCLVLPSFKETFGVVLIEAMSCGLTVIATRSGGPEQIVDSKSGILVVPKRSDAMNDALSEMYLNHSKYNFNEIRESIEMNYGQKAIAEKLRNLYQSN